MAALTPHPSLAQLQGPWQYLLGTTVGFANAAAELQGGQGRRVGRGHIIGTWCRGDGQGAESPAAVALLDSDLEGGPSTPRLYLDKEES